MNIPGYQKWLDLFKRYAFDRQTCMALINRKSSFKFNLSILRWNLLVDFISRVENSDSIDIEIQIPIESVDYVKPKAFIRNIGNKVTTGEFSPFRANTTQRQEIYFRESKTCREYKSMFRESLETDDEFQEIIDMLPMRGQCDIEICHYIHKNKTFKSSSYHLLQKIGFLKPKIDVYRRSINILEVLQEDMLDINTIRTLSMKSEFTDKDYSFTTVRIRCDHNTPYEV